MPKLKLEPGKKYVTDLGFVWVITTRCDDKDPEYPYVGYPIQFTTPLRRVLDRGEVEPELVPHFFNENGEHYYDPTNDLTREAKV